MAEPAVIVEIETDDDTAPRIDPVTRIMEIPTADGGLVVGINPEPKEREDNEFDANLALDMDENDLGLIADDLLRGIEADEQSRTQWLEDRQNGITLLGLKLERPSAEATAEGVSKVRHPVLLEAVLRFQANARAELLPSDGPVKVSNANIVPNLPAAAQAPVAPGAAPAQAADTNEDQQAEELERGFNYYLTQTATEYYPDTNRLLFWTGFGGSGFKKVYNCPLRRRPVSESIDAKDFIVSDAATDLANAQRLTHRIEMRQSVMKRMMMLNVYRDVQLQEPTHSNNVVDDKQEEVAGVVTRMDRPEDQPHTVYECYCEWDLGDNDPLAPEEFKDKGIPLPYRVTIEKDSRQVLEIRRNWKPDDEQCLAKKCFVKYPYVDAMGIYGIGLLHILGNPAAALTAGWRMALDNGMFSNFPGGLIAEAGARGLKDNNLRVAPGSLKAVKVTGKLSDSVMALPYKNLDPAFVQFLETIGATAQRVGGTAEINVGEGKQDAPVGTTIALIEQATKIEAAVHKGLHAAQAEEFAMLKERFAEDPEAFWRHNKKAAQFWDAEKFKAALENTDLMPVADPNTHSHMQRIMRAVGMKQLASANPAMYDHKEIDTRIMQTINIPDPEGVFAPPAPPGPPPPDPALLAAQAKLLDAKTNETLAKIKALGAIQTSEIKDKDRDSKERIAVLDLAKTIAIHPDAQDEVEDTVSRYGAKPRGNGGRVF